ncbi:hypothetical protein [Rhodococcus rhodochrous]|uniref:hypothetical protein n=1 Tax=Rhodococcus rhodochrous TaxID=1829 RepID=UPI00178182F2|nr:hypothetical protein [Rhodococcus rhodochrous]QOH59826.1 hypothetical protein C6Y44_27420 [Rhodococcus rhodochrous]
MTETDSELASLDAQIEALQVLVLHNSPFPGTEHEEPYRTFREQRDALTAKRNKLSADHHLGYLSEEAWPVDWQERFPSHAVATRAAGKNLREALLEAGWADPASHNAVLAERREWFEKAEKLVESTGRIANLLGLPVTASGDQIVQAIAKMRTELREARNPGSVTS